MRPIASTSALNDFVTEKDRKKYNIIISKEKYYSVVFGRYQTANRTVVLRLNLIWLKLV